MNTEEYVATEECPDGNDNLIFATINYVTKIPFVPCFPDVIFITKTSVLRNIQWHLILVSTVDLGHVRIANCNKMRSQFTH